MMPLSGFRFFRKCVCAAHHKFQQGYYYSNTMNVPIGFAYKLEGEDIDDGIENYEVEEKALAEEALELLEADLQDEDFNVNLVKEAAVSNKVPETSNNVQNTVKDELVRDLEALIKLHSESLSVPITDQSRRLACLKVKLCMFSTVALGLINEGADMDDHPVMESINEVLGEINEQQQKVDSPELPQDHHEVLTDVSAEDESQAEDSDNETRRLATREIVSNRGLTRLRPKDRKNPRVNQKRRYKIGLKKVRSMKQSFKSEAKGGFTGVRTMRPHIVRSQGLS